MLKKVYRVHNHQNVSMKKVFKRKKKTRRLGIRSSFCTVAKDK